MNSFQKITISHQLNVLNPGCLVEVSFALTNVVSQSKFAVGILLYQKVGTNETITHGFQSFYDENTTLENKDFTYSLLFVIPEVSHAITTENLFTKVIFHYITPPTVHLKIDSPNL